MVKGTILSLFFFVLIFLGIFVVKGVIQKPVSISSQLPRPIPITSPSPTTIQTPQSTSTPTQTPTPVKRTRRVKIVLFGDSMIQTMGEGQMLKQLLEKVYPDLLVTIVNLGVGATTIEDGIGRTQQIIDQQPDIVIIESFAYNHLTKGESGLSRHRDKLAELTMFLRERRITKIIILATIAPLEFYAKDASESAGWTTDFRKEEVDWIKRYLENAIGFANSENLPLVDAYHITVGPDGYGKTFFVNPTDDIHPSERGHTLVSELLAKKIIEIE